MKLAEKAPHKAHKVKFGQRFIMAARCDCCGKLYEVERGETGPAPAPEDVEKAGIKQTDWTTYSAGKDSYNFCSDCFSEYDDKELENIVGTKLQREF